MIDSYEVFSGLSHALFSSESAPSILVKVNHEIKNDVNRFGNSV
jgi:hypothetical protein